MMFACFRSSRVADDSSSLAERLASMKRSQLIELCLEKETYIQLLRQQLGSMSRQLESDTEYTKAILSSIEGERRANADVRLSNERLQQAMKEQLEKHTRLREENELIKVRDEGLRSSNEEVHRTNSELKLSNEQLERAMKEQLEKHAQLQAVMKEHLEKHAQLQEEHEFIKVRDEGLRTAVNRQMREVLTLRRELHTLKSDLTSEQRILSTLHIKNIQSMVEEMGGVLTDPVSFELLIDPVTLTTGQTLNRDIANHLSEISETKCKCKKKCGLFQCPITRKWVSSVPEQKTVTIAKLSDLYLRMNAWIEVVGCE